MIKVVTRSGNLANLLKTTTSLGGSNIGRPSPAVSEEAPIKFGTQRVTTTAYTSAGAIPARKITAVSGPSVAFSVRFGHTDVKVPDFTEFRRKATRDPTKCNIETQDTQRFYNSGIVLMGGAATLYAAKTTVCTLLGSMAPSADVLALAQIEVNKSEIPEGKNVTFKWRGKPLFIRHRTAEEIQKEAEVDLSSLRDPEPDSVRARDPKWLVVIGICTHLGCVPIANQGDWGGYYCPCHGSHYDASGRIRKGPAPSNLEIPPHTFNGDLIVVG